MPSIELIRWNDGEKLRNYTKHFKRRSHFIESKNYQDQFVQNSIFVTSEIGIQNVRLKMDTLQKPENPNNWTNKALALPVNENLGKNMGKCSWCVDNDRPQIWALHFFENPHKIWSIHLDKWSM